MARSLAAARAALCLRELGNMLKLLPQKLAAFILAARYSHEVKYVMAGDQENVPNSGPGWKSFADKRMGQALVEDPARKHKGERPKPWPCLAVRPWKYIFWSSVAALFGRAGQDL